MLCKICEKKVIIKRKLLDLFTTKKVYLCNNCYKKYPIKLNVEHVLLLDYSCIILSIFEHNYHIDLNLFQAEYEKIFKAQLKRELYQTLIIDYLSLDDYTLETLDVVSKLFEKNLIIITFFLKK